jgi:hypothetical protein
MPHDEAVVSIKFGTSRCAEIAKGHGAKPDGHCRKIPISLIDTDRQNLTMQK